MKPNLERKNVLQSIEKFPRQVYFCADISLKFNILNY